jgi:hypothetical protein
VQQNAAAVPAAGLPSFDKSGASSGKTRILVLGTGAARRSTGQAWSIAVAVPAFQPSSSRSRQWRHQLSPAAALV